MLPTSQRPRRPPYSGQCFSIFFRTHSKNASVSFCVTTPISRAARLAIVPTTATSDDHFSTVAPSELCDTMMSHYWFESPVVRNHTLRLNDLDLRWSTRAGRLGRYACSWAVAKLAELN